MKVLSGKQISNRKPKPAFIERLSSISTIVKSRTGRFLGDNRVIVEKESRYLGHNIY